jgi:hypothetical protein
VLFLKSYFLRSLLGWVLVNVPNFVSTNLVDCCNVTNMVLFLTVFKNILMFDTWALMSFYEKKRKKEINFKSVFMVLPLVFNKDFMAFDQ